MGARFSRTATATLVVLIVTVLGPAAQAATSQTPAQIAANQYLVDHGYDPATFVTQTGPKLYAGKTCPAGFSCVDPAGKNIFQTVTVQAGTPSAAFASCTPGTATGPNGCTILQVAQGGPADLTATCEQGTATVPVEANNLTQECRIDQQSGGGANNATVSQYILHRIQASSPGAVKNQTEAQTADVKQDSRNGNGTATGGNTMTVNQSVDIRLSATNMSNVAQDQAVIQSLNFEQRSDDADNVANIDQKNLAKQEAISGISGTVTLNQNKPGVAPGTEAFGFVRADNGYNTTNLDQLLDHRQNAVTSGAKAVTMVQGNPNSGLRVSVDGDQEAPATEARASKATVHQNKVMKQEGNSSGGAVALKQDDFEIGSLPLPSKTFHLCDLSQRSELKQAPLQDQKVVQDLTGRAKVNCIGRQDTVFSGGTSTSKTTQGTSIHMSTNCDGGVCKTNNVPISKEDSYSATAGQQLTVPAPGVLANDIDGDGDPLTAELVQGIANPTFTFSANGGFSYTPTAAGTDTFTYRSTDGKDYSDVGTVTITVAPPPNRAPTAVNDSYAATDGQTLNVAAPGVLGNDSDPDGDPLTASLVTGPSAGTLTLNANGSFSYTPNGAGTYTFTYKASDGQATSNTATVTITVAPGTPNSTLSLAVKNRNDSTYGTTATVTPFQPTADYRIVYQNTGLGTDTNVVVRHRIPSGVSSVQCGGCTNTGTELVWNLGTQLGNGRGGAPVTMTFSLTFNITSFGSETSKATGTSAAGAFESNSVTVQKQCVGPACI